MNTQQIIAAIKNNKWNGRVYGKNTIYIAGEKVEIDLTNIYNATIELFAEQLSEPQKNRFTELVSYIDYSKGYETVRRQIGLCFNWCKCGFEKFDNMKDLFTRKIGR